jgi:hypothetical protein
MKTKGFKKQTSIFILIFSASACIPLPPYSIYSRAYRGRDFNLLKDSGRTENWNLVIPQAKSPIERNDQRYVFGALVKRLRREIFETTRVTENGKTRFAKRERFRISIKDKSEEQADVNIFIRWDNYGDQSIKIASAEKGVSFESQGATDCFKMNIKFKGRSSEENLYEIHSNGCPGIFDPRPMTSMLSEIWIDKMIPNDTANILIVHPRGNAPDSSLSTFVTDDQVDKFLGYSIPPKEIPKTATQVVN